MRVADVAYFTLANVLQRVDPVQAIDIFTQNPRNASIGTWKLDPTFGTFEVLIWVDPWEAEPTEGNHDYARLLPCSAQYRAWFNQDRVPPLITVVRHTKGHLASLNRHRVLAARDTSTLLIPT